MSGQGSGVRGQGTEGGLPRLCFIADGFVEGLRGLTGEEVRRRTTELVRAGVPWVQLRDHNATTEAFEEETRRLTEALRVIDPEVLISINGNPELALEVGAGVHLGRRGPSIEDTLAVGAAPVGYSAHTIDEVLRAEKAGAGYVTFSPVYPTQTHPGASSTGVDSLEEAVRASGIPIFALGGITPGRVQVVREVGAYGVAVVSALLLADDLDRATNNFLTAL